MNYNCFRLMAYNYIDSSKLPNKSVTSEQSAFPIENAYNRIRRSKVWRSAGFFEVTSSNNQIIFKDNSMGSNKTATIATGNYSSLTSFITAVYNAFDTQTSDTITVTRENERFKFSSNGSYFDLLCSNVSFTAISLLGLDNVDRTGSLTYIADEIKIHSYERITWDLGFITNPNMFALIGKRNEAIKISPNAVIKLQANQTNNFSAPTYEANLTYDSEVISVISNGGLASVPLRFWSLYIEDQNPNGYIEVGSFFLGDYYNPQRGAVQIPFASKYVDLSTTELSEGGQSWSEIKEQSATYDIKWLGLYKEDIEEFKTIFETYGTSRPFFCSLDTNEYISTDLNRKLIFCKFQEAPSWELVSPNNFSLSFTLREEL
jgi:hypothetical protein